MVYKIQTEDDIKNVLEYKKMDGKKILDYLAGFVLAALMSFSLVYPLTTTLGFPYSSFRILGLVIFILFIYSVLFANRNVSRISVPLAIISMAAGIVFLAVKKDLAYWFTKYIYDEAILPDNYYPLFITVILALSLTLLVLAIFLHLCHFNTGILSCAYIQKKKPGSHIVRSKPIEWKWLDNKINSFYNQLGFGTLGFYSTAGFGNDSNLGGNITPNDIKIMEVTTDRSIYLRGRACNLYTGNSF